MKVEEKKNRILLYSWLPMELIIKKNLTISKLVFLHLANLGHFFHGKFHCIGRNHIFQVKIWRNFAKKKEALLDCGVAIYIKKVSEGKRRFFWVL
jgi:hypothetical protein